MKVAAVLLVVVLATASADTQSATAGASGRGSRSQRGGRFLEGRCAGVQGRWCAAFYRQRPIRYKPLHEPSRACPVGWNRTCSGVGVCHPDTGRCDCPAGWGGPACADPLKRPCTHRFRGQLNQPLTTNDSQPISHIDPVTKRDLDWRTPGSSISRCAGICDDDIAVCYCDSKKYGRIPAPPGSPPWTPPVRAGRFLTDPCSKMKTDAEGHELNWQNLIGEVDYAAVYGPKGYCNVDPDDKEAVAKATALCGCPMDGLGGELCEKPMEQFCLNQCSGRGRCNLGFCHCDAPWFGVDCGQRGAAPLAPGDPGVAESAGSAAAVVEQRPWLKGLVVDPWEVAAAALAASGAGNDGDEDDGGGDVPAVRRRRRLHHAGAGQHAGSRGGSDAGRVAATDGGLAQRAPGDEEARGGASALEPDNVLALGAGAASHIGSALSADTGTAAAARSILARQSGRGSLAPPTLGPLQRRRPLVYVYNTPSLYVARMLQYRILKPDCSWRVFSESNNTEFTAFGYTAETLVHEMLLQSAHRTLDPQEADFFYVPVYNSCWFHPVWGTADYPWWYVDTYSRVSGATIMTHEVLQWVRAEHPYWNASGGADHIWLFSHDEGACWAPSEIYNTSIILTHWGRTEKDPVSQTTYIPDNYTRDVLDDPFNPKGFVHLFKGHPCYTPGKDLIMPTFKGPPRLLHSPFMGAAQLPRDILLFHKGDMGVNNGRSPNYSRGVRQRIFHLAKDNNWREKYNITVGTYELEGDYSQLLARSTFCLVAAGDGYTTRFADAIVHGCIPFIVMDGVDVTFHGAMALEEFSVRIAEADVAKIPETLLSIPPDKVLAMQKMIAKVWHRFMYANQPFIMEQIRGALQHNAHVPASARPEWMQPWKQELAQDDAVGTLMQWLYRKMRGRGRGARGRGFAQRRRGNERRRRRPQLV